MYLFKQPKILSLGVIFFLLSQISYSQTIKISGKVIDASTQKVLDAASVVVKNSNLAELTNADGEFSLNVNIGDDLQVMFLGYQSAAEKIVSNRNYYLIQLQPNVNQISDVVVTALGIRKDKKTIGYATQEIKGDDLIKAREPNALNSLVGKAAGLNVAISAEMLGAPQVFMRGERVYLYVIDGIPMNSDTWNINADDIESYTILKGPAAAALYGFRGQNGAIIINTKKGTKNKKGLVVEVNSSTQFNKGFIALPRTQDAYGPGDHGQYSFVDGKGGGLNDNDYDIWGPRFDGQKIAQYDSPIDPTTGARIPTPWTARGKDNLKRFIQTGVLSTNSVSVSSTSDKVDFRTSLAQTYQKGIVPNTQLNTTNFNINSTLRFNKKLSLDAYMNYNRQYTDNIPDVNYGPNSIIYNISIWGGADWNISDMKNYWQPGKEGIQSLFAEYQRYHNPYFMSYEWLRGHQKNDIQSYATLNYKMNAYVDLMLRSNISSYDLIRTEKMPFSAHPYGREEGRGDYREDKRTLFDNNNEFMAKFRTNKLFNFISINGLASANVRLFKYASSFVTTDYLNVPNVYTFSNSKNPVQAFNFSSDMRVNSYYSSVDFGFGKFANLNVTGRMDKLSALFSKNNAYFYPSANLSTVLTDWLPEQGVAIPSALSFAKLRFAYAAVRGGGNFISNTIGSTPNGTFPLGYGSQYSSNYGGPSYTNSSVYTIANGYNNSTVARYTSSLIDENIKPDNRVSKEIGVDLRFLNNRLQVDAAYYSYINGYQIFSQPISAATGFTNYTLNATKTKKNGFEIFVTGNPIRMKNGFSWDVTANLSTFKEKYVELPTGVASLNTFYKVGSRVDEVYISKFARTESGQIINDAGGRPIVLPVAQFAGYANPDWMWGLNNKFSYKNLSFSFQLDGMVGGVMEDYVRKKTFQGGRNIETIEGAFGDARYQDCLGVKAYVGEGVQVSNGAAISYDPVTGKINNYGSLQFAPNSTKTYVQDYISRAYSIPELDMMSKTYMKLREVVIGYKVPYKLLNKTFISNASVSIVARNLLYFMKDKKFKDVDIDQYTGTSSSTSLQTPTTRSIGININVTF